MHLGKGIETALSARQIGYLPTWAVGSSKFMETFPVLPGIEAITIFAENDTASDKAAKACGAAYVAAGCEGWICQPPHGDMNDLIMRGDLNALVRRAA